MKDGPIIKLFSKQKMMRIASQQGLKKGERGGGGMKSSITGEGTEGKLPLLHF